MYLPRLYNPYPFICQTLHFLGHRVKKIENGEKSEWIYIYPRGWKEMSADYDKKLLNIRNQMKSMEEHQVGQIVQFNKYLDKNDESLNTKKDEK